ncbi:MAG TPA: hypothetical protein VGF29_21160, partial [Hyphomicrobiaceae bacterium]
MNCGVCGSVLAHDQRYCLECGSRRGPLPPVAAGVIASLQGEAVAPAAVKTARQGWLSGLAMPTPRAAAVAVMALLAFGVVLGTTVSPAAENAAAPVILAEEAPPPAPVAAPTPAPAPADTSAPAPADTSAPAPAPAAPAPQQEQQSSDNSAPPPSGPTLPPIKHVFLIVLNDQGYDQTFGDNSQAPYLSKTLRPEGELLTNYYGVTSGSLANQIALISGQGPNPQTAANCPQFTDVTPGTVDKDGQVTGAGCLYPAQA